MYCLTKFLANGIDGLQFTRQWIISTAHDLEQSSSSGSEATPSGTPTPSQILNEAYMQILHNPDKYEEIYPEVLAFLKPFFLAGCILFCILIGILITILIKWSI